MIVRQGARLSCAYCATGPASSSTLVSPSFVGPSTVQSSTEQSRLIGSPVSPNSDLRRTRRTFSTSSPNFARPVRDPYKVLSLHKTATKQQIKAKFYELSKKTHPDAPGGSADQFHQISEAYDVLGDDRKRKDYDMAQSAPSQSHNASFGSQYSNQAYTRRTSSGPHESWKQRPPPPPLYNQSPYGANYSPFGRHTPRDWKGSSGGTYGDPFASMREEFERVRRAASSGAAAGFGPGRRAAGGGGGSGAGMGTGPETPGAGGGGGSGAGGGGGGGGHKGDLGSSAGSVMAVLGLIMVAIILGGGLTARAEDERNWQKMRYVHRVPLAGPREVMEEQRRGMLMEEQRKAMLVKEAEEKQRGITQVDGSFRNDNV